MKLLKGGSFHKNRFAFTDQPTQPTSFEAIYFYGGIKYAYGFSFVVKVLTEYLYHWPNGREALVFPERQWLSVRENVQEQLTLARRTARKPALPVQLEQVELPSD